MVFQTMKYFSERVREKEGLNANKIGSPPAKSENKNLKPATLVTPRLHK